MKRLHVKPLMLWGITALIMLIIFLLSAQSRTESADLSMNFKGIFATVMRMIGLDAYAESEALHHFVRKCAHAFLYCVLGISVSASAQSSMWKRYGLWSILICLLYAISDEVHQAFVPGRGPQISDVVLDTVSAVVGFAIFWLLNKLFGRKNQRRAD